MKAKSRYLGNRGFALLTVIIILMFLSVLGASLLALLFSRNYYAQLQMDRLKALYLAEAGIAQSLYELRYSLDPDGDGAGDIPETNLGGGAYSASHNFQTATITGVGEVNDVIRTVEIQYSAL